MIKLEHGKQNNADTVYRGDIVYNVNNCRTPIADGDSALTVPHTGRFVFIT